MELYQHCQGLEHIFPTVLQNWAPSPWIMVMGRPPPPAYTSDSLNSPWDLL